MSANHIKCPSCGNEFDVQDVLSADAEQKIKQQYDKQLQQSLAQINNEKRKLEEEQRVFEEKRKKENELFQQKLQVEKQKMEAGIQQELRKSITADFEHKLTLLQQNARDNEEKLKMARQKEMEYLQKEEALKVKEEEIELQAKRAMKGSTTFRLL